MTSRQIAQSILSLARTDARDRKLMTEHTRRASKALRVLAQAGRVVRTRDDLNRIVWRKA